MVRQRVLESNQDGKTGTKPLPFLGRIKELDNRVLRVVTLDDKTTIHNASPDWRFKP